MDPVLGMVIGFTMMFVSLFMLARERRLTYTVETAELIAVIKVLRQTVMEVRHAQNQGSRWYTKGESGLFQQVRMHLDKADKAIKSIEPSLDV